MTIIKLPRRKAFKSAQPVALLNIPKGYTFNDQMPQYIAAFDRINNLKPVKYKEPGK